MSEKVYVLMQGDASYDNYDCLGVYRDLKEAVTLYCREWVKLLRKNDYGSWDFESSYAAKSEEELVKELYYKARNWAGKDMVLSDGVDFDSVQLQKVTLD